jgi:hypothetical protein
MDRIELFKKALATWHRFTADKPDFAPWVAGDIEFLLSLEMGRTAAGAPHLDDPQQERLEGIGMQKGQMGPLGGLAVRGIPDRELGNLLCEVQAEANKLRRELGAQRR